MEIFGNINLIMEPHIYTPNEWLTQNNQIRHKCLLNYDKKIEFHVHSGFCKLGFSSFFWKICFMSRFWLTKRCVVGPFIKTLPERDCSTRNKSHFGWKRDRNRCMLFKDRPLLYLRVVVLKITRHVERTRFCHAMSFCLLVFSYKS